MVNVKITRAFNEHDGGLDSIEFEYDHADGRPAWIRVKDSEFSARFLSVRTENNSEILYKRFTGGFYYPVDLKFSPAEESLFYQAFAPYYDKFAGKNNLSMAQFVLERMWQFGVAKNAKILDVGAGTGIFSALAAENGFTDFTLLDIHVPMLDEAKKKPALGSAMFIAGDAAQVLLANRYDVFVSIMMFDSLDEENLKAVLTNLMQFLKPGASIFIVEDRYRPVYSQYFEVIDKGLFDVAGESVFQKFYVIGKAGDAMF